MNGNPDNNEIEQIEQGLEAFLEQETCGLPEPEITADWPDEAAQAETREFYIKTDMLPKSSQRTGRADIRREYSQSDRTPQEEISRRETVHRSQASREESPQRETPRRSRASQEEETRSPRKAARSAETTSVRGSSAKPVRSQPSVKKKPSPKRRPDEYEQEYDEDWEDGYDETEDDDYDNYDDERKPVSRPKKKRKKKSFLKRLFIFLLILCVLIGGLWYYLVGRVYAKMNYEEIPSLAAESMKEDGVINILLIGNDSRSAGEDGRSDAMILLSISNKTKTIHMMSLLRDMYVEIPGHEGNRLNAAYAFGGAELLLETLEQNLDLAIHRYVLVNFQAFAGVVDAVGGVDLDLTNEEVQYVNGYLTEYNNLEGRPEGTDYLDNMAIGRLHLNGPQALAYCRIRYIGTDFGRTERQREVLSAVIRKAPKALLTNPTGLLEGLLPNLTTNLTEGECRELSLQLINLLGYDLVPSSIPIQGSYQNASIRGMSVLEVDFAANKAYIRENIYGE